MAGVGPATADRAQAAATPPPSPVQARPADHLVDALGVQLHLGYPDSPYQDVPRVAAALDELGVRHVRDNLNSNKPELYDAIEQVGALGIKFNLIMARPASWDTPQRLVQTLATELPTGVVESLEGANEWNLSGRPDWVAELRQHQRELWEAAKAEPATRDLPILAPSLGQRQGFEELGDLGAHADLGNAHIYPGGQRPSTFLPHLLNAQRIVVPQAPVVVTEAGYHDAMNTTSSHAPTPRHVSAAYIPRLLLEHFAAGTQRLYVYQLLDEFPDPESPDDHEAKFGLMAHDFAPKPAYGALRRLVALTSDPGPSFVPDSLAYQITRGPADLRHVLLQRRDGTFLLVLWRDVSMWDRDQRRDLAVQPRAVRVDLGATASIRGYRPSVGDQPFASVTSPFAELDLGGDPVVLEIDDDRAPPVAGPAPRPAGVPQAFKAAPRDGGTRLRWQAPADDGGSGVLGYQITGLPGFPSLVQGSGARKATVRGLVNGTTYAVWVQAITSAGPSAPAMAWVRPAGTPGKPRAVKAKLIAPGKVRVTWKPPKDDGGAAVDRYRIKDKSSGRSVRVGPGARNVVLRLPLKQRAAKVVVAARNDVGFGPTRGAAKLRLR